MTAGPSRRSSLQRFHIYLLMYSLVPLDPPFVFHERTLLCGLCDLTLQKSNRMQTVPTLLNHCSNFSTHGDWYASHPWSHL